MAAFAGGDRAARRRRAKYCRRNARLLSQLAGALIREADTPLGRRGAASRCRRMSNRHRPPAGSGADHGSRTWRLGFVRQTLCVAPCSAVGVRG